MASKRTAGAAGADADAIGLDGPGHDALAQTPGGLDGHILGGAGLEIGGEQNPGSVRRDEALDDDRHGDAFRGDVLLA
jgi:hypothetical protein